MQDVSIRNSFAHANPEGLTLNDVEIMIRDVEKFVADHITAI
jgi:hypothetical protein